MRSEIPAQLHTQREQLESHLDVVSKISGIKEQHNKHVLFGGEVMTVWIFKEDSILLFTAPHMRFKGQCKVTQGNI